MCFRDRIIRAFVCGSVCSFIVPAYAQKVTLACSNGPEYVTSQITIDAGAKTVTDFGRTHRATITSDTVTWEDTTLGGTCAIWKYDRRTAEIYEFCNGHPTGRPTPCVKAPPPPF